MILCEGIFDIQMPPRNIMELWFGVVLVCLVIVAALYSSVGHGGASGYLAILSLTALASKDAVWLKQHVWCLNLVVAAIAFWHFNRVGHHTFRLTLPFIIGSIPFAVIGGYLKVDGGIYDTLLSLTLVWAAWRLLSVGGDYDSSAGVVRVGPRTAMGIGGGIGLVSGVVGVGGGIFLSPIILLKRWGTPKAAAATAALFIWVNSAAGLIGTSLSGQLDLDWYYVGWFVGAVLVGGFVGSRYGAEIAPQQTVRRLLVVVLVVAAAKRVIELI